MPHEGHILDHDHKETTTTRTQDAVASVYVTTSHPTHAENAEKEVVTTVKSVIVAALTEKTISPAVVAAVPEKAPVVAETNNKTEEVNSYL